MKKILLSLLYVASVSFYVHAQSDETVAIGVQWEKAVQLGMELSHDSEVIEAVMKLHKAFLHFVEVILEKIAHKCDTQDKVVALAGLDYLADIAKDPKVRSFIASGGAEGPNSEAFEYIQQRISPLLALFELYGPDLQQLLDEQLLTSQEVTHTSENGVTTTFETRFLDPNNVLLKKGPLFLLDRFSEILDIARDKVK